MALSRLAFAGPENQKEPALKPRHILELAELVILAGQGRANEERYALPSQLSSQGVAEAVAKHGIKDSCVRPMRLQPVQGGRRTHKFRDMAASSRKLVLHGQTDDCLFFDNQDQGHTDRS